MVSKPVANSNLVKYAKAYLVKYAKAMCSSVRLREKYNYN